MELPQTTPDNGLNSLIAETLATDDYSRAAVTFYEQVVQVHQAGGDLGEHLSTLSYAMNYVTYKPSYFTEDHLAVVLDGIGREEPDYNRRLGFLFYLINDRLKLFLRGEPKTSLELWNAAEEKHDAVYADYRAAVSAGEPYNIISYGVMEARRNYHSPENLDARFDNSGREIELVDQLNFEVASLSLDKHNTVAAVHFASLTSSPSHRLDLYFKAIKAQTFTGNQVAAALGPDLLELIKKDPIARCLYEIRLLESLTSPNIETVDTVRSTIVSLSGDLRNFIDQSSRSPFNVVDTWESDYEICQRSPTYIRYELAAVLVDKGFTDHARQVMEQPLPEEAIEMRDIITQKFGDSPVSYQRRINMLITYKRAEAGSLTRTEKKQLLQALESKNAYELAFSRACIAVGNFRGHSRTKALTQITPNGRFRMITDGLFAKLKDKRLLALIDSPETALSLQYRHNPAIVQLILTPNQEASYRQLIESERNTSMTKFIGASIMARQGAEVSPEVVAEKFIASIELFLTELQAESLSVYDLVTESDFVQKQGAVIRGLFANVGFLPKAADRLRALKLLKEAQSLVDTSKFGSLKDIEQAIKVATEQLKAANGL